MGCARAKVFEAFKAGKPKRGGNYATDGTTLTLFSTDVVRRRPDGKLEVRLGGWNTITTRTTVEKCADVRIWNVKAPHRPGWRQAVTLLNGKEWESPSAWTEVVGDPSSATWPLLRPHGLNPDWREIRASWQPHVASLGLPHWFGERLRVNILIPRLYVPTWLAALLADLTEISTARRFKALGLLAGAADGIDAAYLSACERLGHADAVLSQYPEIRALQIEHDQKARAKAVRDAALVPALSP